VLGDSVGDLVQDLGALLGNQPCPTGFGCNGGGNSSVDIVCGTDDDEGENRFLGGIDDVAGFAVRLGGEFVSGEVTRGGNSTVDTSEVPSPRFGRCLPSRRRRRASSGTENVSHTTCLSCAHPRSCSAAGDGSCVHEVR